jgi:hypothetical protein
VKTRLYTDVDVPAIIGLDDVQGRQTMALTGNERGPVFIFKQSQDVTEAFVNKLLMGAYPHAVDILKINPYQRDQSKQLEAQSFRGQFVCKK